MNLNHDPGRWSRRRFLASAIAAGAGLAGLPRSSWAAEVSRALTFRHTHTGERLAVEYFAGGRYLPDALGAVNHVLRDWRTGEEHPICPDLLDLLHLVARETGTSAPFQVISGYRSPETNAMLRATRAGGVAARSLHMRGMAIDVRLADVPLVGLRTAARTLQLGGVGYYPGSNFVHLDIGRVRTW